MSMMGAFGGGRLQGLHRRGSGHYGYLSVSGESRGWHGMGYELEASRYEKN
jgi:hypothetical protein